MLYIIFKFVNTRVNIDEHVRMTLNIFIKVLLIRKLKGRKSDTTGLKRVAVNSADIHHHLYLTSKSHSSHISMNKCS